MTGYVIDLFVIVPIIFGTLGFNENALIALALYYSRKLILYFVGNAFVKGAN